VYADFRKYIDVSPDPKKPTVAYFSMEYGLTQILKIYSGGLGVLAGDYLKEASDSNIDMVAVGFLYRYGYFTQTLSMDGDQLAISILIILIKCLFIKLKIITGYKLL
jgi:starch phosphorylase